MLYFYFEYFFKKNLICFQLSIRSTCHDTPVDGVQKSLINKQIPSNYVVQSAVIKKRDALSVGQPANPSPTCSCARFGHYSEWVVARA